MKKILFVLPFLFLKISYSQRVCYHFDFGINKPAKNFIKIFPQSKYNDSIGYGFDFNSDVFSVKSKKDGGIVDDFITSQKPFYFSVKIPEGNYLVKVLLGDANGESATTIKVENRRLVVEKEITKPGKFSTREFMVHIRDSFIRGEKLSTVKLKARERAYLHWDNKLTFEFNNVAPKVHALEIFQDKKVPTIFLAGNSTVVDQPSEPWAAWGQMFPAFLTEKIAVANYAESGETLISFKRSRRLEKIWSMAKPGDYLFIEFAHNDQKPGGNHLDPFTTYKQTLKEWIAEARKRKITPVLVTSMNRRRFDDNGKIVNTLGDYPAGVRQTGIEENVTVLDLNAMSKILYEAWGPDESKKAFVHFPANTFPNQEKALADDTHFSNFGAYELAKCIVQAIKISDLPLRKFINDDFKGFDPAKPDSFDTFKLPISSFIESLKPDGS